MNGDKTYRALGVQGAVECRLVGRINRFVVEVRLEGDCHRASINNTGRLHQFLVEGKRAFCVKKEKGAKTDCRLFAVAEDGMAAIIDTQLQMQAFERSLEAAAIPWLKGCRVIKKNASLGDSLIDYLLECAGDKAYLEVKSAVLREGRYAMYPDCPTSRGRRHIRQLTEHVRGGGRAIILFIAALPDVTAFKTDWSADAELCELLLDASLAGVEIRSINMAYRPEDSHIYLLNPDLSVNLAGLAS
ncbi:MAG: DNA/RNA nuclease SfsA [Chloroflexi bacterium]|nr:DNA/RNA nuclease SfsA [Chloroflexota bacterium]